MAAEAMAAPASPPPPPEAAPAAALAEAPPAAAPLQMAAREKEGPLEMQWAPVREFPIPSYEQPYDGPRVDFRETVFWKPSVKTGEGGEAQVQFFLSDAVTTFRASAEGLGGGQVGRGDAVIASKLPVALAARLPLEVSAGDTIELPITVTNATPGARKARFTGVFGKAFSMTGQAPATELDLRGGEARSIFVPLRVVGEGRDEKDGAIEVSVDSGNLRDALARTVRVVPLGFPQEQSVAGKLRGGARHEIDLPTALPGSLVASFDVYPSPTTALVAGTEAMLREPSGCFEQTSSSNYPNVMVLSYLATQPKQDPAVVARATQLLSRGYKRLTSYESKNKGFEWFGEDPGHEALTAYGVVQFTDMARVFPDVDKGMIQRTVAWLKARRDGKGGYQRNSKALDSFGRASEETTAAYITHALAEAGETKGFEVELDAARKLARSTRDPYLLALAADTLALVDARSPDAAEALKKLASLQGKDGDFPGAKETITRSGGIALAIETTALAALALQRAPAHNLAVARALDWIAKNRNGAGGFGSTQSTVLALKALTRGADTAPAEGTVTVSINGGAPATLKLDGATKPSLAGLEGQLRQGKNVIEVKGPDGVQYGVSVRYRTERPVTSGKAQVDVDVASPASARVGEPVKVTATLTNKGGAALPMVLARIGIPGGLTYQTWQLDELKTQKVIDFYETREREVILYLRGMAPKAKLSVPLQLIAAVPGKYTGPASQAYLYYTDEHRSFAGPIAFTVTR
jgi:uncharacterized protein YfaS (alpha-2-macroglobulin family)